MQNKSETKPGVHGYWNYLVPQSEEYDREDLWRAYLKDVYRALGTRWRKTGSAGRTLKTDLYDEAISAHDLFSLFAEGSVCMVGTDVSLETAQAASRRLKQTGRTQDLIAVSDARSQAFKAQVFDEILSNSTLDHFSQRGDLLASLAELHRILKPGGVLIITLDNPWNPVVWVRNRLPYRFLKRLGIIPYFMGVTLSRPELIDALESAGFRVADSMIIVHSPRILAIWAGSLIGKTKRKWMKACFVSLLRAMEYTQRFPTRGLTGYFVAAKAVKP